MVPTGKVRIKVAGKSATVGLNPAGVAVAKIKVPKKTTVGYKTWAATYSGNHQIAAKKITGKIKVTR